jgi:UDP-N-acetylmuramate dehydrogenase
MMPHLAQAAASAGYAGLEWAVGVPGTVGGAVLGNAGAWGGTTADCLRHAEVFRRGEVVVLRQADLGYAYRASTLKKAPGEVVKGAGDVVLRASFSLRPGDAQALLATIAHFRQQRLASQPVEASAGSTFKNPPGDYAGRLIEAAGLKGTRIGQAQISPKHANFIINLGGAKAEDVLALVNLARQRVKEGAGVELELEVQLVGDW